MRRMTALLARIALGLLAALPLAARAEDAALLPLPDGPVVLVIPDAPVFDRALSGGFRKALSGTLPKSDPVAAALSKARVGGKLADQWALFVKDLPLSWTQIAKLQPSALGLTILSAGDLEAVLAVRTPLAEIPLKLPAGEEKSHSGVAYRFVARGAGDERTASRRMGLAWAHAKGVLLVATSERALALALDRSLSNEGFSAFLPGLVSMKLDLDALRKDLYFRREFLFEEGVKGRETGTLRAALRSEGTDIVEVRQGSLEPDAGARSAATWKTDGRSVSAAGWETDASRLFSALRRGFLEPVPAPKALPVAALKPLPDANAAASDRYLVDLTRPAPGDPASRVDGEPGELPAWAEHLAQSPVDGWGWEIGSRGERRLVVKRPASLDTRFLELASATGTRRAGRVAAADGELSAGPGLPAFAVRRTGDWLWIAARRADLEGVPEPSPAPNVSRWSRLDLSAVKADGRAWRRAEGTFSPERARPFSDRILGLLGWAPGVTSISVERHEAGSRFEERVVFAVP
jgi:hypothetical protein